MSVGTIARAALLSCILFCDVGAQIRSSPAQTIKGVVHLDDGRPAAGAVITLTQNESGQVTVVGITEADEKGLFVLSGLYAGRYEIRAHRLPWIQVDRRTGLGGGEVLVVGPNEQRDLSLELRLGAAISGTVSDPGGAPASEIPVYLYVVLDSGSGDIALGERVGTGRTDDRGGYRFLGLAAGQYAVAADPGLSGAAQPAGVTEADEVAWAREVLARPNVMTPPPMVQERRLSTYARTFFGGQPRIEQASLLRVHNGEQIGNIDIRLRLTGSVTVSGSVVDTLGRPVRAARLSLVADEVVGAAPLAQHVQLGELATFTRSGLSSGRYRFVAEASLEGKRYWGVTVVDVSEENRAGIEVRLSPGLSITGRVRLSDGAESAGSLSGVNLRLRPASRHARIPGREGWMATTTEGGQFTFEGLPTGRYEIDLVQSARHNGLENMILTSVTAGGEILPGPVLELSSHRDLGVLTLTLDEPSQLTGLLVSRDGRPVVSSTILVFAREAEARRIGSPRVQTSVTASDGSYRVTGLPAGRYLVAAVLRREPATWLDLWTLAQTEKVAVDVLLQPGELRRLDLQVAQR